jgi:hypothetical protein
MRSPLSPRVQDDATRRPSMEVKVKASALNDAMKSWKGPVQFVEELPCRCVCVCVCVGEAKHVLLSPPRSELRWPLSTRPSALGAMDAGDQEHHRCLYEQLYRSTDAHERASSREVVC